MKIAGVLHINIRCSVSDLPHLEKFYGQALGLENGYRPDFGFPGAWLYHGQEPIIHLAARYADGSIVKNKEHNGSVDHIAFKCTGSDEMRERLVHNRVSFTEMRCSR